MTRRESAESIARFAWRDLRRFLNIFLLCTTCLGAYHVVRLTYGNPNTYYQYRGADGPFSTTMSSEGKVILGHPIQEIRAGERFGWISHLCFGNLSSNYTKIDLVLLSTETIIETRTVHYSQNDATVPCGPTTRWQTVPPNAPAGEYELRRYLTLRDNTMWPLHADLLPALQIRVIDASK